MHPKAARSPDAGTRLAALAALIPEDCRAVADIGSGHGRLPGLLAARRPGVRCIAGEKPGPTARALARRPHASGVEVRVGDGLDVLRDEDGIEAVVVAGLGGRTIAGILERGRDRALALRRVVLQPQGEAAEARRSLYRLGMAIVDERLVLERGRFYPLIAASPRPGAALPAHDRLGGDDLLEAGPCLVRSGDAVVRRYWTEQLGRLESILGRARRGAGRDAARRDRDRARRVLQALGEPGPDPALL
jgi:tRNA (adenine22-N1)-methyltransferase